MKSYKITLAGLNGMSTSYFEVLTQSRIFSTSDDSTLNSSQFLTADSSSILIEYGRLSIKKNKDFWINLQYIYIYINI